ncbi:uncharacterized protein LOC121384093 isoform X2 [Gigantopelta aegis]|uniref:uncharacterized protein LOC121384093 isoform X2 n=1 Tax=Gigantopelta aegis TaxID=1735272 RepID=UPI001B8876D1|nr:uncharacterized protein LOC121384093 isoform X2 [Gigantopelta aegis]
MAGNCKIWMNLNESVNLEPRSYIYSFSSNNMAWACFSVILVTLALTSGVVFEEVEPETCEEVKTLTGATTDGEYWLYPPGLARQRVRIFCHDMAGQPKEFLTLLHPNTGDHPNIGNKNCHGIAESPIPHRSGSSNFTKIRVYIQTMVVDRRDYTFAMTTGRPVPYGEANDCFSIHYSGHMAECGIRGNFRIDTSGTGLVVDQSLRWNPVGWRPYATWHRSDDGAVIDLTCGGWCGGCVPDGDIRLTVQTDTVSMKPGTCRDVKLNEPAAGDGEYDVYPDAVGARRVRVYCHDMVGTPREYVTLKTPNKGVYPNLANKNCRGETKAESPEKTGQSIFNKIRVNIETMVIDPTDYTFADTEGVPVPYGEAKDCYSIHYGGHKAKCGIKGTFTINTAGTGLVIDKQTRWEAKGWNPYAEVKKSDEGEIVNLLCGGWCGGCKADRDLKLTLNPNEAGLRTCSDVRAMDPNAGDGEYTLYPKILSGEGLQVYCDNMSENPREYLSLSVVNIGVSPDLSNVLCKEETESVNPADVGSSEFSKIRINTETLEVNQSDYRFATVSGHRVAYGRAHDCYTYEDYRTCGPKGFFVINTSGTGLRVNTTLEWILTGDSPSMNVTRSDHGAVIHLSCGGFCGGCIPIHQIFLEKNPEDFK